MSGKNNLSIILIFSLLIALPLLHSCSGHNGHTSQVTLDNGNLWQANPETTQGIANMQAILTKYEGKRDSEDDREALGEELEAEFKSIFKQCTMTGDGHIQLHNYLVPMKKLFDRIEEGTAVESEAAFNELKQYLASYQTYFK